SPHHSSPPLTLFPYTTLFRSPSHGRKSGETSIWWNSRTNVLFYFPGNCSASRMRARSEGLLPFLTSPGIGIYGSDRARILDAEQDRKSTRLNSSHVTSSYGVF